MQRVISINGSIFKKSSRNLEKLELSYENIFAGVLFLRLAVVKSDESSLGSSRAEPLAADEPLWLFRGFSDQVCFETLCPSLRRRPRGQTQSKAESVGSFHTEQSWLFINRTRCCSCNVGLLLYYNYCPSQRHIQRGQQHGLVHSLLKLQTAEEAAGSKIPTHAQNKTHIVIPVSLSWS